MTIIYVKYISNTEIQYPPINKDGVCNYNINIDLLVQDGYKQFIEVEKPSTNRLYHIEYEEKQETVTEVIVYDETQEEAEEREAQARQNEFEAEFFETSLGWIRRKVTMKDGSIKDFLSDLLPSIMEGLRLGIAPNIITYREPDFTQEVTDWTVYQVKKEATQQFVQDCLLQISEDFGAI